MTTRTKRTLTWLGVIFIAFMIATQPVLLADWVETAAGWVSQAFEGLFTFFEALVE